MRPFIVAVSLMFFLLAGFSTPVAAEGTCPGAHVDGPIVTASVGDDCVRVEVCTFGLDPTTPDGCRVLWL